VTDVEASASLPTVFALHQNYPNPFNPATVFEFDVPRASFVDITVFDIVGRPVMNMVHGQIEAGRQRAVLSGHSLSSGVYLVRMETQEEVFERTVMLLK
jgi:hypothetical protein